MAYTRVVGDPDEFEYPKSWTEGRDPYTIQAGKFFAKLTKKTQAIADRIVKEEARKTLWILKHRLMMGGSIGQYPRYDVWTQGTTNNPAHELTKHSYREWTAKYNSDGTVDLFNTKRANDGFNYPLLLAWGSKKNTGGYYWASRVKKVGKEATTKAGFQYKKLKLPTRRINVQGFSTQMPRGIQPFLDLRKKEMEKRFRKALKGK